MINKIFRNTIIVSFFLFACIISVEANTSGTTYYTSNGIKKTEITVQNDPDARHQTIATNLSNYEMVGARVSVPNTSIATSWATGSYTATSNYLYTAYLGSHSHDVVGYFST